MSTVAKLTGTALLKSNGAIELHLRIEQNGVLGDALVTIAPNDQRYPSVLAHVAPIQPGVEKLIEPLPLE